jgi:hypothetical protein
MPPMRLLDRSEFLACFAAPMRNMTAEARQAVDVQPYVKSLDFRELCLSDVGGVAYVYRDARDRFDQILIKTAEPYIFLVIVVAVPSGEIFGHHVLDLEREYGLKS